MTIHPGPLVRWLASVSRMGGDFINRTVWYLELKKDISKNERQINNLSQAWWHRSVIPARWVAKAGRFKVQSRGGL